MMNIKRSNYLHGMTVLELLIILTALAVVLLISVPSSSYLLETYRLNRAANALGKSLETAFHHARLRHSVVRVCPSSDGKFCRRDGDWDQGWLIFSDGNGDGVVHDIELIQSFDAPNKNIRILASGAVVSSASFNLSGLVEDNGYTDGEFQICHLGSNTGVKSISIDADGWVAVTRTKAQNCDSI